MIPCAFIPKFSAGIQKMAAKVDLESALNSLINKTDGVIQTLDGNFSELEKRLCNCLDFKKEIATANEYLTNRSQQLLERHEKAIEEKVAALNALEQATKSKCEIQKSITSANAVLCEVEMLQEKIAVENEKLNTRREELSNFQKRIMEEIKLKEDVVALYETFFGFELKKTEDKSLLFIFKYINKDDPQETFFFQLKLDKNKEYQVTNCQPMLSNLDQLVSALNETSNLKRFVCTMRKEFCKLATK